VNDSARRNNESIRALLDTLYVSERGMVGDDDVTHVHFDYLPQPA
jgi:hypothetical protein